MSADEQRSVPNRGIVYLAIGAAFVAEAGVSAASARRHLRLPCTLYTDEPEAARALGLFDQVIPITPSGPRPHRDKLVVMRDTPYEHTLMLDTDTYVGAAMDDCWALLERFDLAMAVDRGYVDRFLPEPDVPPSFKEPNLGVVFFRRTPALRAMLEHALALYDHHARADAEHRSTRSQPPFRVALYRSVLRVAPLPDEDNCRFAAYGKLNGPVRVLHGRLRRARHDEPTLRRLLDRLNATTVPRVFVAGRAWALQPRRWPGAHQYRAEVLPAPNVVSPGVVWASARQRLGALWRWCCRGSGT